VTTTPLDPTARAAVRLLDTLTEEEFCAVRMAVKPYGISRDDYRAALTDGSFDASMFIENVACMRHVLAVADAL
jgi:hypothetical protein